MNRFLPTVPLFLSFLLLTLLFFFPKSVFSAVTYIGTDPATGNPANMECPSPGACTCETSIINFGSNFAPCEENGEVANNVCCTSSGGCATSDPNNPTIGLWDWDYAIECYAEVTDPLSGSCDQKFNYGYTACGAYDSCTASQALLNAGQCNPSGCAVGGIYKTCCNSDGTLNGWCTGGEFSGTCPPGSQTVICGVTQADCDAVEAQFPGTLCTTNACGSSACSILGPGPTAAPGPGPTPAPPPPGGCNFSQCGDNNCGWDEVYVAGDCSGYAWFTGDGCYYDSSCPAPGGGGFGCYKCAVYSDCGTCTEWREGIWGNPGGDCFYCGSPPAADQCWDDLEFSCDEHGICCGADCSISQIDTCKCWPGCETTIIYFEPSAPDPGDLFYIKVESNGGYQFISLSGTDGAGNPAPLVWDGVFSGESGYSNQWRWHISSAVSGTYSFTFSISEGTSCETGCQTGSVTVSPPPPPDCTVDLVPATSSITQGDSVTLVASVTTTIGTVDEVHFSSSDPSVSVSPAADPSYLYTTAAIGGSPGSATITAEVHMSNLPWFSHEVNVCSDTAVVEVRAAGPWWQTQNGDVWTFGDVVSNIPQQCVDSAACTEELSLTGPGGYPGMVVYGFTGSSIASFGRGSASSTGWLANSGYSGSRYDYDYFRRLAPSEMFDCSDSSVDCISAGDTIVGGELVAVGKGFDKDGYTWRYAEGDLNVHEQIPVQKDKKIVIVEGDLNLGYNGAKAQKLRIKLDDGEGFMMFIVRGDINISHEVREHNFDSRGGPKPGFCPDYSDLDTCEPALKGIFLADGRIITETHPTKPDYQLRARGMFVGWGGIDLNRDLDPTTSLGNNNITPPEYIEYAPDFFFTFPGELNRKGIVWREIAP